ncbi:TonB-dependent receptor domain-containing protein [Hymenobacter glacialis]|uniref:Iron dicitrate transporter n=1 Tax=Hymenobacter glacialis TaxID=1908236 RepID=A0A1G1T5C3_9BACT|nr:TonB-dependent receptor [Hymenobacter glacialis]OGX86054.1 iron dicitrate transporter [Hymenobacter glacialis]
MMRLQVYSALLLLAALLLSIDARAQETLRGRVLAAGSSQPVAGGEVYVQSVARMVLTDSTGRFEMAGLAAGMQQVRVSALGYQPFSMEVRLPADGFLFELTSRDRTLSEVVVAAPQTTFGQTRLREVEGMAIFAAKKSEVIVPENLVANLATNNARQVYARVPGLNIWENDGGGLQLSIGGRGLDPNRTSNFNVRQNNYDISADALGYPESYYTPPTEAVKRIQLVRGAASLQYGTQFGGLLNFEMRAPDPDNKAAITSRQTVGSFGFFNSFNSVGGTVGKLSYYTFVQYKRGNGWRPNSEFDSKTAYADVRYQATENVKVGLQYTHMDYLAQQPGGLTDAQFQADARQSNRERNWFAVDWNLFNANADWKLNARSKINLLAFGLVASRQSLGFRPADVTRGDEDKVGRDLISGDFRNYGLEARFLTRYQVLNKDAVLLLGTRYYRGSTHSRQGFGPAGRGADFRFVEPDRFASTRNSSDYRFPNHNVALFAENIFYLTDKLSVTPGVRYEYIRTQADGVLREVIRDRADNIIATRTQDESRVSNRGFVLGGIGVSFKPREQLEFYGNVSQNYRSITFSDMQIVNPSSVIDPNLQDERGYSADLGVRGEKTGVLTYDVSVFALNYANRIGEVQDFDNLNNVFRRRTNIGRALILGVESYGEIELLNQESTEAGRAQLSVFGNVALIRGRYLESQLRDVKGKQVEFVPAANLKLGTRAGYGPFKASLQYLYLSDQFSDATNAPASGASAVIGTIPAYQILDASVSWERRWLKLEASVNNLADARYFTRRATAYPGPGILPSDGRSFFLTVGVKL